MGFGASKQIKLILSRQPAKVTETGNVKYKVSRVTQNRLNAANELIFNSTNYFRYPEIVNIIKNKVDQHEQREFRERIINVLVFFFCHNVLIITPMDESTSLPGSMFGN